MQACYILAIRFHRRFCSGVLLAFAGVIALIGSIAAPCDGWANTDAKLDLEAVSNRADLVSGGDVLLRVTLSPGLSSRAVLSLNGQRLENALHPAPDGNGYLALVSGLSAGRNTITLSAGMPTWRLVVTNHPIGGPIFSGPHLQPWQCTTQEAGLGASLDVVRIPT